MIFGVGVVVATSSPCPALVPVIGPRISHRDPQIFKGWAWHHYLGPCFCLHCSID